MADKKEIYKRFLNGKCSPQEAKELLSFFEKNPDSLEVLEMIQQEYDQEIADPLTEEDKRFIVDTKERFAGELPKSRRIHNRPYRVWIAAASVILLTIATLMYIYQSPDKSSGLVITSLEEEVQPGGNYAMITLADGKKVVLDSSQSSVSTRDGKFYYDGDDAFLDGERDELATLSTPIGGTYRLVLADGTKVWLNAGSSVTYPVRFTGQERVIKVTGEVYLEVAPDLSKPFIVESGLQQIRVLGTAFNLRTYENRIITTLLHGKIALEGSHNEQPLVLEPGDQVILSDDKIDRLRVNAADYAAWTEGVILNRDASLKDIIKELERWYDVRFVFTREDMLEERAIININRTEVLSAVLQALEDTYQVRFTIKGKEVLVK